VQRYNKFSIYARGNGKLPQICSKNDQIRRNIKIPRSTRERGMEVAAMMQQR
jgi:hypothetical protein